MASALDKLNAYMTHETDEDQAEFAARLAAREAEVRADAFRDAARIIRENPATAYDRILGQSNLANRAALLGDMVTCSGPNCRNGEWSAKAQERGWTRPTAAVWACPQCSKKPQLVP